MRLTEKVQFTNDEGYVIDPRLDYAEAVANIIQKQGRIEDLEEKIKIGILVIADALANGVYIKDGYNGYRHNGDKWFVSELENDCAFYRRRLHICQFRKRKEGGLFCDDEYCPPEEREKASGVYKSTTVLLEDFLKTWSTRKEDLK